jgi:2,4-dichlorophenol 6-monooxygenase
MHDVQNLCWKLAAVLGGHAAPELLDTYEPERRSSDERNAQRSLENAVNHFAIGDALGVSHENSPEQNWAALRRMWSGAPEDAEHRSRGHGRSDESRWFSELNVELGYAMSRPRSRRQQPALEPVDEIGSTVLDEARSPLPHA